MLSSTCLSQSVDGAMPGAENPGTSFELAPMALEFTPVPRPRDAKRNRAMQISTEEMTGGITRVALEGRLDIAGAALVDLKMNIIAGSSKKLLIDLENVSFLGSMGLRSIVLPARAVLGRGGKVVLFAPTEMVESVIKTSGIDSLLPVHHDLAAAVAALQ
jgi:anti-sigma B factor antagonist